MNALGSSQYVILKADDLGFIEDGYHMPDNLARIRQFLLRSVCMALASNRNYESDYHEYLAAQGLK